MVPFFVTAPLEKPQARICILIPTFTYTVYANIARGNTNSEMRQRMDDWGAQKYSADDHTEYGVSTYNYHSDGSGISYSSRRRPIITMRSNVISYPGVPGSGWRHFPADSHLWYWLEVKGQSNNADFIRVHATRNRDSSFDIYEFSNSDSIIFHNTINENNTELIINIQFVSNQYFIGLSGQDFNLINEIGASGIINNNSEPLNINIQNQVAWISIPNTELEKIEILISYLSNDINQDSIWNIIDIIIVLNYILGQGELNNEQQYNADMNNDNVINIIDIIGIVNLILNN